jgi:subtilisin family serine protease
MKQWIRLSALALLVAGAVSLAPAATLSTQERAKIHPDFQALLAMTYPDLRAGGGSVARLAKVNAPAAENTYHAIVYTSDPGAVRSTGATVNSVYPGFVTAQVSAGQILALARIEGVSYIDEGSLNYPANDVSIPETGASLVQGGFLNNTQYRGAGAIVLIYDTGIDWKHKDFRSPTDSTKSRILSIWDQTLTAGAGESTPAGLPYGVEYSQAQINAELGTSPPGFVREKDTNGHGTHVAGTATGNGLAQFGKFSGMAPDADIIVVKGGNGSFSESLMIDGLTYAQNRASALGKPIVVNWSIGGQSGPHDGTRAYEIAINTFVSTPGRVVAVAAGNDGASPIHIGGNAGATTTFTFTVPAYTPGAAGTNQFLFDLWLNSNTNVSVSATSPDGYTASAAYNGGLSSGDGSNTADGLFTVVNQPSYTSDGAWNVYLWVRDNSGNNPKSGTWTLTVTNPGSAVRYDGWLASKTVGSGTVTLNGGDVNETLSMPGTANGAITTAAYVTKWSWPVYSNAQYVYTGTDRTGDIATFSAIGPTRDGRQKPDIAAPGMGITSALSTFEDTTGLASIIYPGQKHFVDQGTSMATPHITGASALILGAFPTATAASIKSLFTGGAIADAFTGSVPNMTWGYGKLDMLQSMAKKLSASAVVTRTQYGYDGTGANALLTLTGTTKYAVRISPTVTGKLTGITLNVTTPNNNPIQGTGNIIVEAYTNVSGLPGTKIGSSVTFPLTRLNAGTPNYIQLLTAGVSVTSGTDFQIVVSIANPAETLLFRTENVGTGTRSSTFNGSSWSAVATNHRIHAIVTTATGVNAIEPGTVGVPVAFELGQNYPNPFNPSTRIGYTIGERGLVTLEVFDVLGRAVATLVNESQAAGSYQIVWNGRNSANIPVTSGVYFYRLRSGAFSRANAMVLLK